MQEILNSIKNTKMKNGLFVGLTTLDFIYLVDKLPERNEKIVARNETIAAGGPATNAAITFNYLGNSGNLLGIMGSHPISNLIKADLSNYSLHFIDLQPHRLESPPVSSIIVTKSTGERAVISINAQKSQASTEDLPEDILKDIDIVLIDGHQIPISQEIAKLATSQKIPVVLDGGSWKPGLETVLPWIDYAICSANFYPPNCQNREEVINYLQRIGINYIAITNGEKPIEYLQKHQKNFIEIPPIQPVDTLGAGDIFHGAFCHYLLQENFPHALEKAAKTAAYACQFFGTRQWMQK